MWFAGPARRAPLAGRPQALRLGFDLKRGMKVGLYGGSFNPAHYGHAHVAETARRKLGLDRVIMHLCNTTNIRDVIAFPKTQNGADLMLDAPGPVDERQMKELHIRTYIPPAPPAAPGATPGAAAVPKK